MKKIDQKDRHTLRAAADFVKEARRVSGKSQRLLAEEVGTSASHIWLIESAGLKRGPNVALLGRIAQACGRTLKFSLE